MIMRQIFLIFAAAALASCGPSENDPQPPSPTNNTQVQDIADDTSEDTSVPYPYNSYCFERVGQIGAEPRRGDSCKVHGHGAGQKIGEGRNRASIHISAPSLEAIGMWIVNFQLYVGHDDAKFPTGVQIMDQVRRGEEADRIFVGSSREEPSYFTHTGPDADFARKNYEPSQHRGYEVTSAVLTINSTVDIELDDNPSGYTTGVQFVEGTFTVSFIPMGSEGVQYGPTTFEFGTQIHWGMMP